MVVLYVSAGINHFIHPEFYIKIMPLWIPFHDQVIFISGICEILFALFLIFPATRHMAAWCIIGLLIAIFPANVQMMINYTQESNARLWLAILRLPLQILLTWWAYGFTKPLILK